MESVSRQDDIPRRLAALPRWTAAAIGLWLLSALALVTLAWIPTGTYGPSLATAARIAPALFYAQAGLFLAVCVAFGNRFFLSFAVIAVGLPLLGVGFVAKTSLEVVAFYVELRENPVGRSTRP